MINVTKNIINTAVLPINDTMKKPTIIGFYGESNTGKTTIIEKLIKKLTEHKYKVTTVKITDKEIGIDTPGKDTYIHSQAGSQLVVLSTSKETDYLKKQYQNEKQIINSIKNLDEYDIIIIEGSKEPTVRKIRIGTKSERENTIQTYNDDFDSLYSMIKKEIESNTKDEVTLIVNGKQIPLTEFPSLFIKDTVIGMIKPLKGVKGPIENVEIRF